MSNKRYGSRGSIITSGRTKHTSQTGSGSSSRRTGYGDVLSKKWENRMKRDPESSEAHNTDAIRKHIILNKLNVTSQARMERLKTALTHPYGRSGDVSYQKARTYDQRSWDEWETMVKRKKQEREANNKSKEN